MTGLAFACEKQPAVGSRGMVVANHPLAAGVGAEILLAGGNAIDAAIGCLFALTVGEPMMVGLLGGGVAHIRAPNGVHTILDGLSTAPAAARPDMYRTLSGAQPDDQETVARENHHGPLAVAVPGALAAWCEALGRYGSMPLADVIAPATRLAESGFTVTPYLSTCVADCAAELALDHDLSALFLPGGHPIAPGTRLRRPDYAQTLRQIAAEGPNALYRGQLGTALHGLMASAGGCVTATDLAAYAVERRHPVRSHYRGFEVIGPPPPASSGVHIAQMLNLLEGFDVAALGFGTPDGVHLLAEVMKIAFADRPVATADPAFIAVPVETLLSPAYAAERRPGIDMARARSPAPGLPSRGESADTTHVTVADGHGNVVSTTQTINGLFGARIAVPGTGLICNNYMFNFDPHPGRALSIAPGKRVFTSMAPMMVTQAGRLRYALGLPGALRIFPSALQALLNLIDHGMTLQQAVEAPRIFTQGHTLELELPLFDALAPTLAARGHQVQSAPRIAGGMNAIEFQPDGAMLGAACWRADGTAIGLAGGLARPGVRFVI